MLKVTNDNDLRLAYLLINLCDPDNSMSERAKKAVAETKRSIREYTHRPCSEERVVRDDGDSLLSVFPLPEWVETEEEAEELFESKYYRQPVHSLYDCTGRIFTNWYKLFRRGNRWWAYHRMSMDV